MEEQTEEGKKEGSLILEKLNKNWDIEKFPKTLGTHHEISSTLIHKVFIVYI